MNANSNGSVTPADECTQNAADANQTDMPLSSCRALCSLDT